MTKIFERKYPDGPIGPTGEQKPIIHKGKPSCFGLIRVMWPGEQAKVCCYCAFSNECYEYYRRIK